MYIDSDTSVPNPGSSLQTADTSQVAQVDVLLHGMRPRSLGELIDGAFRLYRRQFLTMLAVVSVISVPVQIFFTFVRPVQSSGFSLLTQASSISDILVYPAWAAVAVMVVGLLSGTALSFSGAYRAVFQMWKLLLGLLVILLLFWAVVYLPSVFAAIPLTGSSGYSSGTALLAGCSSILAIPYSILLVRLQVVVPALVLERLSPTAAIRHSWELTRNYWWRTFGLSLIVELIIFAASLGPDMVFLLLASALLHTDLVTSLRLALFVQIAISTLVAPLNTIAVTLYYLDLRVRKEGLDIQTAIMRQYPAPPPALIIPTEPAPYGVKWYRPAMVVDETVDGMPANPNRVYRTRKSKDTE